MPPKHFRWTCCFWTVPFACFWTWFTCTVSTLVASSMAHPRLGHSPLRLATVHETQPLSSPGCLLQVLLGNQGSAVALSCNLPASTVTQYVVVVAQLPATNTSAGELLCMEREAVASGFASSNLMIHVSLMPRCAAAPAKQLSTQHNPLQLCHSHPHNANCLARTALPFWSALYQL